MTKTDTFTQNQVLRGNVRCPNCGKTMANGGQLSWRPGLGEVGIIRCRCGHVETRPIERKDKL